MPKLVLVRHGQSTANQKNIYTGWNDVPLSELGVEQAIEAGQKLAELEDFNPTMIHTSVLTRAIKTANIIAEQCDFLDLPMNKTWRLNERHYGALRGVNKDITRKIFGDEQVLKWRRSYDAVPPKLGAPITDRRYENLDRILLPQAESLHMASSRILPYYNDSVAPRLRRGEDQLIVAHGSSLRAIVKYFESISNADILHVEVPNAKPIVYDLNHDLSINEIKYL